ncbi:hypothetical protein HPB52_008081 [Rhipicephalus sanguineus]|uniref:Uncharacterized protein n=1 Tax=Rhipicephalus sanguineus TaxID=34632 RepID=A0A9D4PV63_RHISA|nr:hypothetical protein HPB52_008081 [Rhipicephalus sanguineus]
MAGKGKGDEEDTDTDAGPDVIMSGDPSSSAETSCAVAPSPPLTDPVPMGGVAEPKRSSRRACHGRKERSQYERLSRQGEEESTDPPLSSWVVLFFGSKPEFVGRGPSDWDDRDQYSALRKRKRLQLKLEGNKEAAAVSKTPELAPKDLSIYNGARPVDTAAREREIEARLARQHEKEQRRQIRHRKPLQDSRKDDRVDCSVPHCLEGTTMTVEDGNHRRRSSATTAVPIRNVARMILRLAMMHLYEANQETLQSNCQLIASDGQADTKVSSAVPSTNTAAESCPKRNTLERLRRKISS